MQQLVALQDHGPPVVAGGGERQQRVDLDDEGAGDRASPIVHRADRALAARPELEARGGDLAQLALGRQVAGRHHADEVHAVLFHGELEAAVLAGPAGEDRKAPGVGVAVDAAAAEHAPHPRSYAVGEDAGLHRPALAAAHFHGQLLRLRELDGRQLESAEQRLDPEFGTGVARSFDAHRPHADLGRGDREEAPRVHGRLGDRLRMRGTAQEPLSLVESSDDGNEAHDGSRHRVASGVDLPFDRELGSGGRRKNAEQHERSKP